jgi:uncharacterized OsmC-like protein
VNEFIWTVRVRADSDRTVSVHARNLSFHCGDPVSFRPTDTDPSALELLLGGFAADVVGTFRAVARRRRILLDFVEMSANCTLHDPLAHIGVIGEEGDPSLKEIRGALYVSSDADNETLNDAWQEALRRSPLYRTLSRAADVQIRFEVTI